MNCIIPILLLVITGGCTACAQIPQATGEPISAEAEQQIHDLIEQLASKNSPPTGNGQPFLRYPDNWNKKHQDVVRDASRQLRNLGKPAFPLLLASLDDDRYSHTASYSVEINESVGEVCGQIIESNVRLVGMRYKARTGADGKTHMCPNYFWANYRGDLKRWWRDNRQESLREMRIDVLKWRIAQEQEIGFPPNNGEWERKYMAELNSKLNEIEAEE